MKDYSPSFTLSVTVMLLFTKFTTAPDDKSTGVKYCQKISEKSIADTHFDTAYEKYCRHYW